eukprot:CAMPEP_0173386312 /NCGR_PEP_ID=MMETSP1356-20130122/8911_1 /TAXON_ID=77927 ORGANISM="Hemiselmis virescens, Strain PCC157" /NCGR_SAMPLE_ID=MMETSP1356 /ASSEMBLY_ACC=CAM_ASM_000847 /LENGTH=243 /DNA_ID=CAMNT_0014342493 /DNA_START=604 /DNA_END=1335 /DNA_ORIENTATION=-
MSPAAAARAASGALEGVVAARVEEGGARQSRSSSLSDSSPNKEVHFPSSRPVGPGGSDDVCRCAESHSRIGSEIGWTGHLKNSYDDVQQLGVAPTNASAPNLPSPFWTLGSPFSTQSPSPSSAAARGTRPCDPASREAPEGVVRVPVSVDVENLFLRVSAGYDGMLDTLVVGVAVEGGGQERKSARLVPVMRLLHDVVSSLHVMLDHTRLVRAPAPRADTAHPEISPLPSSPCKLARASCPVA